MGPRLVWPPALVILVHVEVLVALAAEQVTAVQLSRGLARGFCFFTVDVVGLFLRYRLNIQTKLAVAAER